MKQTLNNTFIQLIGIYSIAILLISLGLFWKYTLQFHLLAILIGILGITILSKKDLPKEGIKHINIFVGLGLLLILIIKLIPYTNASFPIGYDSGIYKYGIENFNFFNTESWLKGALTPGFFYLTFLLKQFFSTNIILSYIFIIFSVLLGLSIYLVTKEYSNQRSGLIALALYAISIVQFKVFTYLYYKNIIGITAALFAIYFLKKERRIPFIVFGVLTGIIHRPTFFIFGLSYLCHIIFNRKNIKQNIINGFSIVIATLIFYIGFFKESILPLISPVTKSFVETGTSPGTFINFFTYQYSVLAYLPFALLGAFYLIKKKEFSMLLFWSIITFAIVYFQFFFFNRFIIMLDIALIILAGLGLSLLMEKKAKLGTMIVALVVFSLFFVTITTALDTTNLISNEELESIQYFNTTEENAFVMSTSSLYSPYILGYSNRKTIAPGLFQYNKHNEQEWITFWTTDNTEEIKQFLNEYEKPLYIFIGEKQKDTLEQFEECFNIYYENEENKIYKYTC